MLVLTRRVGEVIRVGDIQVKVASVRGDKVRLAVTADESVPIHREEVYAAIQAEKARTSTTAK